MRDEFLVLKGNNKVILNKTNTDFYMNTLLWNNKINNSFIKRIIVNNMIACIIWVILELVRNEF